MSILQKAKLQLLLKMS